MISEVSFFLSTLNTFLLIVWLNFVLGTNNRIFYHWKISSQREIAVNVLFLSRRCQVFTALVSWRNSRKIMYDIVLFKWIYWHWAATQGSELHHDVFWCNFQDLQCWYLSNVAMLHVCSCFSGLLNMNLKKKNWWT